MANDEEGGSNADVVLADAYVKGIEWGTKSPINVRNWWERLEPEILEMLMSDSGKMDSPPLSRMPK